MEISRHGDLSGREIDQKKLGGDRLGAALIGRDVGDLPGTVVISSVKFSPAWRMFCPEMKKMLSSAKEEDDDDSRPEDVPTSCPKALALAGDGGQRVDDGKARV
ncbi:hypothetical protein Dimus_004304 [Dionaea muscipula]